jgi:hypothetical protein
LFLPIIAYTLSSTKLEIRAKQFLPSSKGVGGESEGVGEKGRGGRKGRGQGEGGRNYPNIVWTYE